jgi:hypothetical protein
MDARVDTSYGQEFGIVELTIDDGYHAGTTVTVSFGEDEVPVVKIDTPEGTETHDLMRVYMNDALISDVP